MLEWLRSAWTRWKVQVSFVGGALVVATAYGTCSYDPQEVSEAEVAPEVETETIPVSNTTSETETNTGTSGEEVATDANTTTE